MLPTNDLGRRSLAVRAFALFAVLAAASLPAQPRTWVQKPFQTPRYLAASAYDSTRQCAVVFGGVIDANFTLSHETWEWDGQRWTLHEPEVRPRFGIGSSMAYDRVRERTVLFQPSLRETWEWDGHEWVRRNPANRPAPNAMYAPMTFDEASQRILLFHPSTAVLWAWDGVDWTAVASSGPPARPSVMVFDPVRQRTTLLSSVGETWDWNGATWTRTSPTGPTFVSSGSARAAFDRARGVVVLRVHPDPYGMYDKTWEWDGSTWRPFGALEWLVSSSLWYDQVRGRVVSFGGIIVAPEAVPPYGWMDEWDGSQWSDIDYGMEVTSNHAMAYDSARERVVLVGINNGTAEWDGASWSVLTPPTAPAALLYTALAYDAGRGTTVLYGGQGATINSTPLDETWEWDGSTWTQRMPIHKPPPLAGHAMVYDAARGRVLLFGGGETWEWDGVDWTQRTPAHIPTVGGEMAYDAARQRVVLFGYTPGRPASTWEWDGVDWTQRTPASSPSRRYSFAMAYDSARQRTVLFGGLDVGPIGGNNETWEWDGNTWTQLNPTTAPAPRSAVMAYHAATDRMVLFGGQLPYSGGSIEELNDTWVFGPTRKAASASYGNACPGTRGAPRLGSLGRPMYGSQPLELEVLRVLPGAPTVLLLSTGSASTALGGGCDLAVAPPIVAIGVTARAAGLARFGLSIPLDETLTGVSVYGQAVVVDPQGAWLQLAFSRGLRLIIGE